MAGSDWAVAAIGAVIGLLIQGLGLAFIRARQYFGQEFSGKMYEVLPPSNNKPQRVDLIRIRQSGQRLRGTIKRLSPEGERGTKWKMSGYTHGSIVVFYFYPMKPKRDASSYGVALLHRYTDMVETRVWAGYYVRPDLYGLKSVTRADLARYPLLWQRDEPMTRNHAMDFPWPSEQPHPAAQERQKEPEPPLKPRDAG